MAYVRLTWVGIGLVVSLGCGPSIVLSDEGGDASSGGDTTNTPGEPPPPVATTAVDTSGGIPPDPSADEVTSSPPPPPPDPVLDVGGPGCIGPGELGAACADNSECCSGMCFVVGPLGGVCSDCLSDADCELGCSMGNPLEGVPAVCTDGGIGAGCETSDGCADGLVCNTIIEVPGILESSSCGQCASDLDCAPGLQCAPQYDLDVLGGFWRCVPPGLEPVLAGCDGPEECATNVCVGAELMGIPVVQVCSECANDADCGGAPCILPAIDIQGTTLVLEGGICS